MCGLCYKYQTSIERHLFVSCSKHMAHHTVFTALTLSLDSHGTCSLVIRQTINTLLTMYTKNTLLCSPHDNDLRTGEGRGERVTQSFERYSVGCHFPLELTKFKSCHILSPVKH